MYVAGQELAEVEMEDANSSEDEEQYGNIVYDTGNDDAVRRSPLPLLLTVVPYFLFA